VTLVTGDVDLADLPQAEVADLMCLSRGTVAALIEQARHQVGAGIGPI
jgi:predicted DNA-binding protein (UPF0251 family)